MSRHRFVRNLTEDDYYDDDDDYDDEPLSRLNTVNKNSVPTARVGNLNKGNAVGTPKKIDPGSMKATQSTTAEGGITLERRVKSQTDSDTDKRDKQQTLISMGFAAKQAFSALVANNWNVEQALENALLASPPPSPAISHPRKHQQVDIQRVDSTSRSKHMIPPPGFGPPPSDFQQSKNTLPTKDVSISSSSPSSFIGTKEKSSSISTSPPSTTTHTVLKTPSKNLPFISVDPTIAITKVSSTPEIKLKDPVSSTSSIATSSSRKNHTPLLESFAAEKSRLSMVILGHVDAGKSTLMGQVLLQMGYIEKRTVNKYRKQAADIGKASFALAWVMDEDESEREHGVTMDIATKTIVTSKHVVTILDSPGHAEFIPAMITGAAAADVAILVIAATPGEFEAGFRTGSMTGISGGQTREHIILARGLGVTQLIVAINKLDSAQPIWSQARFYEIQDKLKPFLKSNGFLMKRVQFIPVSGLLGINITVSPCVIQKEDEEGYAPELSQWYTGPTLMGAIDTFEPAKRDYEKPMRFIISDVYTEGKNVIVQGRVIQGYVSVGDKVLILPIADESVIQRMDPGAIDRSSSPSSTTIDRTQIALAGDCVDLVLKQIDSSRIFPGNVITHVDSDPIVMLSNTFQAKVVIMDEIAIPIIQGAEVLFHMHNIDIPAIITKLITSFIRKTGSEQGGDEGEIEEVQRPRVLIGGSTASVEIRVREKICLETYQHCRALGRFALRREGDTIAVGIVECVR